MGDDTTVVESEATIKIAAFNVQIFGKSKRSKPDVMDVLKKVVREFDVVLIQEIRDVSETTAPIFLETINDIDNARICPRTYDPFEPDSHYRIFPETHRIRRGCRR